MNRREFIKQSGLASSLYFVPQFLKACEKFNADTENYRKLVVIQLSGGNDGLNTVIPFRNDIYYKRRPGIAIPKETVLKATDELGFHGSLAPLKQLYDQGYLSIINGVGYPNPNRSHFRSSDIWHTASDSKEYLDSGWLGRYINAFGEKPYAGIELDDSLSLIMKGDGINGVAVRNPQTLYRNTRKPYFDAVLKNKSDAHLNEHNLGYLYKTMIEAKSSAKYIYETSKTFQSALTYPDGPFAAQLKTTAQFINSGLGTKVYYVSMGGFDTHSGQNAKQSKLLGIYADAIKVFIKDLDQNGSFKDTLVLTFSEFGRRVKQNAGQGTDHGTANNIFLMGKNLREPGFYNNLPNLSDLDNNGDLRHTVDFREVYATILDKWLQTDDRTILRKDFGKLHFI